MLGRRVGLLIGCWSLGAFAQGALADSSGSQGGRLGEMATSATLCIAKVSEERTAAENDPEYLARIKALDEEYSSLQKACAEGSARKRRACRRAQYKAQQPKRTAAMGEKGVKLDAAERACRETHVKEVEAFHKQFPGFAAAKGRLEVERELANLRCTVRAEDEQPACYDEARTAYRVKQKALEENPPK